MKERFKVEAPFEPSGDQPEAIEKLCDGINKGFQFQTLLGVTGSGKTFTMAKIIEALNLPTLVISPNKTLAVQLYSEFREFFPHNAVELFMSYYDYYRPEAYIPETDTYLPKDAAINEDIDKMRLSAISSLLSRRDVVVVASVSCIYSLENPEVFAGSAFSITEGMKMNTKFFMRRLSQISYERNDIELRPGNFRSRGFKVDVFPPHAQGIISVVFDDDVIESIYESDPLTGERMFSYHSYTFFPSKYFVTSEQLIRNVVDQVMVELDKQVRQFKEEGKYIEAQRIEERTKYDMEMLLSTGYCSGIENYSRYFSGRREGQRPYTLLDYFRRPYLMFIDESHLTIPQIRAMFHGEMQRKETLVRFGFRLPSAKDNRPLNFDEFLSLVDKVIFVSATPGPYELEVSEQVVEQIVRPTGLVDPEVVVKPAKNQVDDLVRELTRVVQHGERALVLTLTKQMAEKLSTYLSSLKFKVRYLHSEIDVIERSQVLKELRTGVIDIIVGINLLREGLDLPEVSLVAVLDADKEGFLRSERSLIQMIGRASRNVNGRVILYADQLTDSLRSAVDETNRRREKQLAYNKEHGITPQTVRKRVVDYLDFISGAASGSRMTKEEANAMLLQLEQEMYEAAEALEFEKAIVIRDKIKELKLAYKV
ncbi:MAG TPA: excinuclease ABC subunit UvrB [Coprothermobacter proteolyticus]|uniref:excinuclease ABC subunit UvrB n=1 Tax=Coprothermobacter proteolyticus TaxID=35786 RepID=UPI000B202591|nr:excinuclease ABC subunit UvrB [Coprothermobacter proteolyticus]MBK6585688.1 excinuclease ABC subunit UvrB [Coprothermobacter sp.]MBP8983139.1 excinuclease ABC subunit UvrB [Coprothermobacter sp.]NLT83248.1 excinuclease ABC subunit UvrB [Coprothermobacter proteolyticus]HOA64453.1 excinuclease ABC subunit UvrB [Coprothermobacter proteolyticus]HOP45555.1 excinuclease ABC subunit UvrB [Coprothermobacter proteolyticus]